MSRLTIMLVAFVTSVAGGIYLLRMGNDRQAVSNTVSTAIGAVSSSSSNGRVENAVSNTIPDFVVPSPPSGTHIVKSGLLPGSLQELERTPELNEKIAMLDPMGEQKVDHKLRLLKYLSKCLEGQSMPQGALMIEQWYQTGSDGNHASVQEMSIQKSDFDPDEQQAVLGCARQFNQSFELDFTDNVPPDGRYVLRTNVVFPLEDDVLVAWLLKPSNSETPSEPTAPATRPTVPADPNDPNRPKAEPPHPEDAKGTIAEGDPDPLPRSPYPHEQTAKHSPE